MEKMERETKSFRESISEILGNIDIDETTMLAQLIEYLNNNPNITREDHAWLAEVLLPCFDPKKRLDTRAYLHDLSLISDLLETETDSGQKFKEAYQRGLKILWSDIFLRLALLSTTLDEELEEFKQLDIGPKGVLFKIFNNALKFLESIKENIFLDDIYVYLQQNLHFILIKDDYHDQNLIPGLLAQIEKMIKEMRMSKI
ncbi:MAG: hypothetical protein KatS3mg086_153 [Candidatus Dojkabacteria bacterium]|nr:MAG: hypothetical protein KatS3mg086_153 [Candidatus Dojkabacteria bacterium]